MWEDAAEDDQECGEDPAEDESSVSPTTDLHGPHCKSAIPPRPIICVPNDGSAGTPLQICHSTTADRLCPKRRICKDPTAAAYHLCPRPRIYKDPTADLPLHQGLSSPPEPNTSHSHPTNPPHTTQPSQPTAAATSHQPSAQTPPQPPQSPSQPRSPTAAADGKTDPHGTRERRNWQPTTGPRRIRDSNGGRVPYSRSHGTSKRRKLANGTG